MQEMVATSPERLTSAEADRQEIVRKDLMNQATVETSAKAEQLYSAAMHLARSIVSDISLYREAELEEAVKTGEIESCLGLEIRDGRAIYENRLPEFASFPRDFYAEALAELISQKKQELRIDEC